LARRRQSAVRWGPIGLGCMKHELGLRRWSLPIVGRITDALRSETTATMIFPQPGSSMSKRCSGALSYLATPKLKPTS
jgi:hypothetical protein